MAVHRAHTVNGFLNWLVARKYLDANPFAELRQCYGGSTADIVRGLASPNPEEALAGLRPPPDFASHLASVMRDHINRMRTLGMRYRHDYAFRQFDRFLAARPGASGEPLNTLVREYVAQSPTAAERRRRLSVGRLVAQALRRADPSAQMPIPYCRQIEREAERCRRRPYIYTEEEIGKLLNAARNLPSPHAPFRPIAIYTMIVLAYCVGLRVGEIARLTVGDVDLSEESVLIRETKFFKSRQLPLSKSVATVLRDYLDARRRAGFPSEPDSALFWHEKGPYAYQSVHLIFNREALPPQDQPLASRRQPALARVSRFCLR
jgi:integrase